MGTFLAFSRRSFLGLTFATALFLSAMVALGATPASAAGPDIASDAIAAPVSFSVLEQCYETRRDIDGDCIPNRRDRDVDGDGISNRRDRDVDGDGISNRRDRDIDGDGIPNRRDRDMDGDGISNRRDRDRDGDGIPNSRDRTPNGPRGRR
jgi:hypothetical protein